MVTERFFSCIVFSALMLGSCVTTTGVRVAGNAAQSFDSAADLVEAARSLAIGGRAGLTRWVRREPVRALAVTRCDSDLPVVGQVREEYARQNGFDAEKLRTIEALWRKALARDRDDPASEVALLAQAIDACGGAPTCHLAFNLGMSSATVLAHLGRQAESTAAWEAALARGLGTNDESGLRAALASRPAKARTAEPEVRLRVAELAFQNGRRETALIDVRAAVTNGTDPRARLIEAKVLLALGRFDEAARALEPLAACMDDDVRRAALAVGGVVAAGQEHLDVAIDLFRRALAGGDSWNGAARASSDLAVVLVRLGRADEGRAAFSSAREVFTRAGDIEGFARTCMNESIFERTAGRAGRADELEGLARNALRDSNAAAPL